MKKDDKKKEKARIRQARQRAVEHGRPLFRLSLDLDEDRFQYEIPTDMERVDIDKELELSDIERLDLGYALAPALLDSDDDLDEKELEYDD